jgi:hypothetical protein
MRWTASLILFAVTAAPTPPDVVRIRPIAPEDGASVAARPIFEVEWEEPSPDEETDPRRLELRITLDERGGAGRRMEFDQRRQKRGWLAGDPGRMIYRPLRPIPDGLYQWRAWVWNGIEWIAGERAHELRIDSVPPAEVDGLGLERQSADGSIVLTWKPVALDRNGRPEYVLRYHVYRYDERRIFRTVRAHEIGTTELPRFVDRTKPAAGEHVLFYRVTAEDEAGNEPERRD